MNLKKIPFGTAQSFNVVVEIPKGSKLKTELDDKIQAFVVKFEFRDGYTYPWSYGLIPETIAEDGDHLDVILLGETPIPQGNVVKSVALGILKLKDRGVDDHKVIALPERHHLLPDWNNIDKIPKDIANGILAAAHEMARQKKKKIEIIGFFDKKDAEREIQLAHEKFVGVL